MSETKVRPPEEAHAGFDDVQASLGRAEHTARLDALAGGGISPRSLAGPFHDAPTPSGVAVRLRSTASRSQVVRLEVESRFPAFRREWVRWSLPARRAADSVGGDAVDAQDGSPADGAVRLLLLPGESREATLDFDVPLDGINGPGDVPLFVTVEDAERKAPKLRLPLLLKVRHPDSALLRALPSIYAEAMFALEAEEPDKTQPQFFTRFLLGFQDGVDPLWAALDAVEDILGPFTTPARYLSFLSEWTAMPSEEAMPEMSRRRYLAEAVPLVRWRGTARGMRHLLRIVSGGECRIDEASVDGMKLGSAAALGASGTKLGNVGAHFFRVTLTVPDPDRVDVRAIHRAITWCKPAHTVFELALVASS